MNTIWMNKENGMTKFFEDNNVKDNFFMSNEIENWIEINHEEFIDLSSTMNYYMCNEYKAIKILRHEVSVWFAWEYFSEFTDKELGIYPWVDLVELSHELESKFNIDEDIVPGKAIPMEFIDLFEYLESRYENFLESDV